MQTFKACFFSSSSCETYWFRNTQPFNSALSLSLCKMFPKHLYHIVQTTYKNHLGNLLKPEISGEVISIFSCKQILSWNKKEFITAYSSSLKISRVSEIEISVHGLQRQECLCSASRQDSKPELSHGTQPGLKHWTWSQDSDQSMCLQDVSWHCLQGLCISLPCSSNIMTKWYLSPHVALNRNEACEGASVGRTQDQPQGSCKCDHSGFCHSKMELTWWEITKCRGSEQMILRDMNVVKQVVPAIYCW
jgi:hypothetical protein